MTNQNQSPFPTMTFESFRTNSDNQDAFNAAKEYTEPGNPAGVFICGGPGIGKTHLLYAAYNRVHTRGAKAVFVPDLFTEIKDNMRTGNPMASFIKTLTTTKYLMLDDLASEKISEFTIEVITTILNRIEVGFIKHRTAKLFITSNLTLDQISEAMGDRIASRISGLCVREKINDKTDHREEKLQRVIKDAMEKTTPSREDHDE